MMADRAIVASSVLVGLLAGVGSDTFIYAKGYSYIKAAQGNGTDASALEAARRHHRRAQFLLDFIEAENSMGFHADQEAVRVLALSLDETRRGQAALYGKAATQPRK